MPPSPTPESFARETDPPIRGWLHRPSVSNEKGLILAHGAGSSAQAPLLVALSEIFSDAGYTVLRIDLPYRQTRSFGPPSPATAARDRAGLKNAVLEMKTIISGKVFLGGHSYGGRQSSMLCVEHPDLVAGLLLLSYPLHPPRKPEQQRTQHLPDLRAASLFISGTRDPFGSIAEIEKAIKMIPAKVKLVAVEGAGHDLGLKGKAKKEGLTQEILAEFNNFFAQSPGQSEESHPSPPQIV
jgi:predicted alpha/beta-hydrolase family hydrolase